jgi:hypothetical protein
MSAGGLSYSAITNHGKITLPSIEGGLGSQNILRDPPKSIMTRRIDKVGETSSVTSMIDNSHNRACEAIQVYARGVNPFVSVSYSNHGSNGGQRANGLTEGGQQAAKLPYPVMRDGAFRPPVLLQEDLLPLSRMPRNWTSAYSQPGFADFSRKMRTCGTSEDTKEVKTQSLKACIRPTAVYQMETPLVEPFEVKYVIQPSIKTSATSGVRTMDITQQHVSKPTKEIDDTPLHARAQANYTDIRHVDNNDFNPERYLQDTNAHAVVSNVSSNKHQTAIEDILDLADMPVQDIRTMSASAPVSGVEQTKYFHEDINLSRRLPEYHARTNLGNHTVHKRMEYQNKIELERNMPMNSFVSNPVARGFSDHSSRDARLAPKIQPGGYSVPGQIPRQGRPQEMYIPHESEKAKMSRMVMESMQGRFDKPAPFGAPNTLVR